MYAAPRMSTVIRDDTLLDDMATAIGALRDYFRTLAEHDLDLDVKPLDGLLARYENETGRRPAKPSENS